MKDERRRCAEKHKAVACCFLGAGLAGVTTEPLRCAGERGLIWGIGVEWWVCFVFSEGKIGMRGKKPPKKQYDTACWRVNGG